MRWNKKVIESTVVAFMLMVVTAVTAVTSPTEQNIENNEQEIISELKANGVAGIIGELAAVREASETEIVSIAKAENVMVANAQDVAEETLEEVSTETEEPEIEEPLTENAAEKPELTEEEQAWSNKLMADVKECLNVREKADEESEVIGKLYRGDRAKVIEQVGEWTHIKSGKVNGYVKTEYCVTGTEALEYAKTVCKTVATVTTEALRLRNEANEEADIYTSVPEGTKLTVDTDAKEIDGWLTVSYDGSTFYVSEDYVEVALNTGKAITIEEEQAQIAKAKEEEEKKAAQTSNTGSNNTGSSKSSTTSTKKNNAVSASYDDVTLLAALIQCEAGSESYAGKLAVGAVVMNRMRSSSYPSSISGVIYQSGQFTPASSGALARVLANGPKSSCIKAAKEALSGVDNTGGAKSFRRKSSGNSGTVIGNHVFF